jgi:hypothetical protein
MPDGQWGGSFGVAPPAIVPEPSTWAMMLAGFAGLALAGYRRAKAAGAAQCARLPSDRMVTREAQVAESKAARR